MEDTIYTIYSLFMFITGTLFGSFFSLATYRIPRMQDITHTRSYCPVCKHKLGFFDCFPILSYISTVGRCKYCNCYISYRYILLELINGFVFLFSFMFFGFSIRLLIFVVCYVYLFVYIGSDIMRKKMTPEEIAEVEKIKKEKEEEKKNKKKVSKEDKKNVSNKKAGGLNVEILVAIILFIFFFVAAIGISRNYKNTYIEYRLKSNALNICLNEINKAAGTDIQTLESDKSTKTVDGTDYICSRNVSYINAEQTAKDIVVRVEYKLGTDTKSIELKKIIGGI